MEMEVKRSGGHTGSGWPGQRKWLQNKRLSGFGLCTRQIEEFVLASCRPLDWTEAQWHACPPA